MAEVELLEIKSIPDDKGDSEQDETVQNVSSESDPDPGKDRNSHIPPPLPTSNLGLTRAINKNKEASIMRRSEYPSRFGMKLGLLLRKNLIIQRRHWIITLTEILLPILVAIIIAAGGLRITDGTGDLVMVNTTTTFRQQDENELVTDTRQTLFRKPSLLAYVPENNLTTEIMEDLFQRLKKPRRTELKPFDTEEDLIHFFNRRELERLGTNEVKPIRAAIIFGRSFRSGNIDDLRNDPEANKLQYTIRVNTYTINTKTNFPEWQYSGPSDDNLYSYTSSMGLQLSMDKTLIKILTEEEIEHEIHLQPFPYPPYTRSQSTSVFQTIPFRVSFLLILGFLPIFVSVILRIVSERDSGVKELMKISGLPNWMHWLGWMLNSLLLLIISITVTVFCLFQIYNNGKEGPVFLNSDPALVWFTLLIYAMATTAFSSMISVLSDRVVTTATMGIIGWLLFYYGLASYIDEYAVDFTFSQKMLCCIFPNMALHQAINAIFTLEYKGFGANWRTMWRPYDANSGIALYHLLIMLVVDTMIFLMLTIYLENVLPSKYGVRKPWYYIFEIQGSRKASLANNPELFEKESATLSPTVEIANVSIIGSNGSRIIDGLSLKAYENQITVILGHEGTGKTLIASLLNGFMQPTSGTITVNGHNMDKEMDLIRENLGFCPENNLLFDKLTVLVHLSFFGKLKRLNKHEVQAEAETLLKKLQMEDVSHKFPSEISEDQRRKLAFGISIIGKSKVLVLDECTEGMDRLSRQVVRDLLLEMKEGRTIILTTKSADEAERLGDRILVMADCSGKIKCSGSPSFLRKQGGAGYILKLKLKEKKQNELIEVVQSIVPTGIEIEPPASSSVHQDNENEITILLPQEEKSNFPKLFEKLDEEKDSLGILGVNLSYFPLYEALKKTLELEDQDRSNKGQNDAIIVTTETEENINMNDDDGGDQEEGANSSGTVQKPVRMLRKQLYGLFQKKYNFMKRSGQLVLVQLLIPVFLFILALLILSRAYQRQEGLPSIQFSLSQYRSPTVLYSVRDEEKLGQTFYKLSTRHATTEWINPYKMDLSETLLNVANHDLGAYRDQYVVAANLNSSSITAMYNSIPNHAAPISMNLITNTLLRTKTHKNYEIETSFHPLGNEFFQTLYYTLNPGNFLGLGIPILFGILVATGLSLNAAGCIIFLNQEQLSQLKKLQLMTGVNKWTYWGSSFFWDLGLMMVVILVMAVCFPVFSNYGGFWPIIGILLVYGYSLICFSHLISVTLPYSSSVFAWTFIIHVVFGVIFPILFFLNDGEALTESFTLQQFLSFFRWISRAFSSFGGSMSLMRFAAISSSNGLCSLLTTNPRDIDIICDPKVTLGPDYNRVRQCCPNCEEFGGKRLLNKSNCFETQDFFTWHSTHVKNDEEYFTPGIGQELLYTVIITLIHKFLIVLIKSRNGWMLCSCMCYAFWQIFSKLSKSNNKESTDEPATEGLELEVWDEDVEAEKERVQDMEKSNDALVVKELLYLVCIDEVNFGVHHGECFGLLGVTEFDKSVIIPILTGHKVVEEFWSGEVFAFGHNLKEDKAGFLSNIGFCPQIDEDNCTIGSLSGRELLTLFCHLRGVPFNETKKVVEKWLKKLGLENVGDKPCENYSKGMKLRVNLGIAMIGDPPLILLDEPTTGIDSTSKGIIYKIIQSAKASGQAIFLASQNVEEIETLCSRFAMMKKGRLQCIGSPDHIVDKYGSGYTLTMKLDKSVSVQDSKRLFAIGHLKDEIMAKLDIQLFGENHESNTLQFQLQNPSRLTSWATIFRHLEDIKKMRIPSSPDLEQHKQYEHNNGIIEDYNICKTTLKEVFQTFQLKQVNVKVKVDNTSIAQSQEDKERRC